MARTLPWGGQPQPTKKTPKRGNGNGEDGNKRLRTEPELVKPAKRTRRAISPSITQQIGLDLSLSSPPVSPVKLEPPPEMSVLLEILRYEYMIEGLNNDDQYIMVEDEFLHTAQLFTRHLHQAEYDRIREQIEKETDKGNRISTLVDIGDASTHRSKDIVRTGVFNEENDNDSRDDDLWAGTMLHSLMTGPAAPPSLAAIHSSQTLYPSPSRKSQNHRGKFKADHGVVYSSPARPIDLVPSDKCLLRVKVMKRKSPLLVIKVTRKEL